MKKIIWRKWNQNTEPGLTTEFSVGNALKIPWQSGTRIFPSSIIVVTQDDSYTLRCM